MNECMYEWMNEWMNEYINYQKWWLSKECKQIVWPENVSNQCYDMMKDMLKIAILAGFLKYLLNLLLKNIKKLLKNINSYKMFLHSIDFQYLQISFDWINTKN